MFWTSPKQAQTQQPPLINAAGLQDGIQTMSPENRKSQRFALCKLPWAPAMHPSAKDGWPPSRKLFGSLCGMLRLLTRAHPGLGYCPYKTAQGGWEPNVLNVPGRKMLTRNPCGRTVQYNYDNTQRCSPRREGPSRPPAAAPRPSAAILPGPGLPGRPLCNRIWEMGAHVAGMRVVELPECSQLGETALTILSA